MDDDTRPPPVHDRGMASLIAAIASPAFAEHWDHHHGPWPGVLFGLFWLAVVTTVIVLWLTRWRHHDPGARAAERVLAERYARGDIDDADYRSRLEVLRRR